MRYLTNRNDRGLAGGLGLTLLQTGKVGASMVVAVFV